MIHVPRNDTNQTLGDILYPGFWLVENRSTVRYICCRWTLYPKIKFQPTRTCLTHAQFRGITVGHVSCCWTCIALHSVLLPMDRLNKSVILISRFRTYHKERPLDLRKRMFHRNKFSQSIWGCSWDDGTYHKVDHRRIRRSCTSARSARLFAVRTHATWKKTKGPTKHQTSNPTGWLRMCVWRMSLRRTKSTIISWDGSYLLTCYPGCRLLPPHFCHSIHFQILTSIL